VTGRTMTSLPKCVTYILPGGAKAKIRALNLTRQSAKTVVTIYYPRGEIRFTQKGALPPWARLIHTEHRGHTADLHKVDNPFHWHAHVVVPAGREIELVQGILSRHSTHADRDVARIRSRWDNPPRKETTYKDGATVTYTCNADKSGLGLLADLDLGNAKNLTDLGVSRLISEAAVRMRPTSAKRIVELLMTNLPESTVATWQSPVDGSTLAHRAVGAGSVEALNSLLSNGADVNAVRKRDGNTVAHLAAHSHKMLQSARSAAILKRVLEEDPDLRVKNKYGETVETMLGDT
jgi:hypothetical protein